MGLRRSLGGRSAIVAAYVVVFWLLLPWMLWQVAGALDRRLGWMGAPRAWGWLVLVGGVVFLIRGMRELWRGGGGLPIGALPPPRFTRRGPYRLVRHPIYVGFNVALFGAGIASGSAAMTWLVAPGFLPVWIGYALVEERGLVRRFGGDYRRYRRQVGLLPRVGLYRLAQALVWGGAFPIRLVGAGRVPRRGPVVLVFNHRTLFDPALLARATTRPIHFLTTAEAYRGGFLGWLVRHFVNVPLRRYRQDPVACREMLRLLAEEEVIGMAVETERAVLGRYQGVPMDVARIVARLGVPVVPVGISGSYDAGPRWAGRSRRRPIRLRVGPPVVFSGGPPAEAIDRSIGALIDDETPPVHLAGLPRGLLDRVLWRCPACGDEAAWRATDLACGACGERWEPTAAGMFRDRTGGTVALAELGERVQRFVDEDGFEFEAEVLREPSWFGPIRPLGSLGRGRVRLDREGLTFGVLRIAVAAMTTVTTERADTLQVTTRTGMWQVRPEGTSVFRLQAGLDRWRTGGKKETVRGAVASPPPHTSF